MTHCSHSHSQGYDSLAIEAATRHVLNAQHAASILTGTTPTVKRKVPQAMQQAPPFRELTVTAMLLAFWRLQLAVSACHVHDLGHAHLHLHLGVQHC